MSNFYPNGQQPPQVYGRNLPPQRPAPARPGQSPHNRSSSTCSNASNSPVFYSSGYSAHGGNLDSHPANHTPPGAPPFHSQRHQAGVNEDVRRLQRENMHLSQLLQNRPFELEQLQSELKREKDNNAALNKQFYNTRTENRRLKEERNSVSRQMDSLDQHIQSLQLEVDQLRGDKAQLSQKVSILESEREDAEAQISELTNAIDQNNMEITNLKGDNTSLLAENRQLREAMSRLEDSIAKLESENSKLKEMLDCQSPTESRLADELSADEFTQYEQTGKPASEGSNSSTTGNSSRTSNAVCPSKRLKPASSGGESKLYDDISLLTEVQGKGQVVDSSPQSQGPEAEKRHRSSIAHPPRFEINPAASFHPQKSVSAEDLNTLDRRRLRHGSGEPSGNQGPIQRFQKNSKSHQSLTKMSHSRMYMNRNPSSKSSLFQASYYEELPQEAEESREAIEQLLTHPVVEWDSAMVGNFFELYLKMPSRVVLAARKSIKSGKVLLELPPHDLATFLQLSDDLQRKRVQVNLQVLSNDPAMPQEAKMFPKLQYLDVSWVARVLMPHLGLHYLSEEFERQMIDGLLLTTLTEKEIAAIVSRLRSQTKVATRSIRMGLRLLREFQYDRKALERRTLNCLKKNEDALVWSNERLQDWLKSEELGFDEEIAGNLKNTGIHGAFLVYHKTFTVKEFAHAINLNLDKRDPRYMHLQEKFDELLREPRDALKENSRRRQAQTIGHAQGAAIAAQNAEKKRGLSSSLSRASRFIRRSSSRGSSRNSSRSREASQERRSVSSVGMVRDSLASSLSNNTGIFLDLSRTQHSSFAGPSVIS